MRRFEARHLAAVSLISILPFSLGCQISFLSSGEPGSGVSKTEARTIDDFQIIEMAGSGDLNIQCGSETTLTVTTDDNLLELLETETYDDRLKISFTESVSPTIGPVFDITTESLSEIEIAGSSRVHIDDFDGETLSLTVAGSGQFKVVGVAETVNLTIAGSGKADLTELVSKDVSVEIAGSGDARVNAVNSLNVSIAGSGSIKYVGEPEIKKSIFGSGEIRQIKTKSKSENKTQIEVDVESSDEEQSDDDDEEDD